MVYFIPGPASFTNCLRQRWWTFHIWSWNDQKGFWFWADNHERDILRTLLPTGQLYGLETHSNQEPVCAERVRLLVYQVASSLSLTRETSNRLNVSICEVELLYDHPPMYKSQIIMLRTDSSNNLFNVVSSHIWVPFMNSQAAQSKEPDVNQPWVYFG